MSADLIACFIVAGNPIPKQSFRYVDGGGYTPKSVKIWQNKIGWAAKDVMIGRDPVTCPVKVSFLFVRKNKAKVDFDNLSKCALDGMKGIIFEDDDQVEHAEIFKVVDRENPALWVIVESYDQQAKLAFMSRFMALIKSKVN